MLPFRMVVCQGESPVQSRLGDFGLSISQITAIAAAARTWAEDASPLMPLNAPGTLAYIFGVHELRQQIVDADWQVDRSCGIEAVVNHRIGIRIGYQNVDQACDPIFPPAPRSAKGSGAELMCGPTLFEHAGVEAGPLHIVQQDGIPTYYVMVGEDGSVELSHPIIKNGNYAGFSERIFVYSPTRDFETSIDPENGPLDDFDVAVSLKEEK